MSMVLFSLSPASQPSVFPHLSPHVGKLSLPALLLVGILIGVPVRADDFPEIRNTQEETLKLGSPEQTAASMRVPEGFRVTVAAAEPMIRQPIAMATDARGRLWVVENYTYAESSVNYDTTLRDRVVILEDTSGDGRFDKRTIFWDQSQKVTSVEIGFGGVWLLAAPQMLFIPDRDRDDVPDGPPEVLLDGWNDGSIRHNIVNGLRWGPDGWLYGRHGIQATSLVGAPDATPSQRTALNCCIWRFHPVTRQFEVVTRGTTNPWGFDYDEHGQMFFINTVIGHLWHVVPGAHFERMYGADFNPYLYQLIGQTADHFHWDTSERWSDAKKGLSDGTSKAGGGHAHCGLMIYLGDNWPQRYRNDVFTVNLHGLRINNDRLERHGNGYVATHRPDFLLTEDAWFRGIELTYGPDGTVYILDWSDIGECHENDGVHRTSGRIYRVSYGRPAALPQFNLQAESDASLVKRLLHTNDWYPRKARRILQERAAAGRLETGTRDLLLAAFGEQAEVTRKLRAMWALAAIDAAPTPWLVRQLQHPEEHVRVWAIRLLADRADSLQGADIEHLAERARRDPSGLVRLFLASTLQRLPVEQRWAIAEPLALKSEDADDASLPLMLWYGIEPPVSAQPDKATQLALATRIPKLREFIARRLTTELERSPRILNELVARLPELTSRQQDDLLRGMTAALRGWRKAPVPATWDSAARQLARSDAPGIQKHVRELSVVFGDGRAMDELLKLVRSNDADPESRRAALRVLIDNRAEGLLPTLKSLANDRILATEAVRGLAYYPDPAAPDLILKGFDRLQPDTQQEAIQTLTSRAEYAEALLDAIESKQLSHEVLDAYHARQIQSFGAESLNAKLARVWGEVRDTSLEKQAFIAELTKSLTANRLAEANLERGRALFTKSCANCHTLYGTGGKIGPDLTGSNRRNLQYVLENIVDPSATMINDFKVSVIELQDGRVVTGVVLQETPQFLTVQTQREQLVLPKSDVVERVARNISLMPEGLLDTLSADEIRDLIAYLGS